MDLLPNDSGSETFSPFLKACFDSLSGNSEPQNHCNLLNAAATGMSGSMDTLAASFDKQVSLCSGRVL
jgi:hypothetical protein